MRSFIKHILSGRCLFLLAALLLPACVSAAALQPKADPSVHYYDSRPKEGWYWYQNPVIENSAKPGEQQAPPGTRYSKKQLYDMYPDQFQQLLKVRLKTAVQYPTEENVEDYLTMQDIARRKSAAFASAVQFVTQKNASTLSVNDVYPETTPGIEARVEMQQKEIENTIRAARNDHAILFFWRPGCGFCEKQVGILKYFTDKYGWQVKPINSIEQKDLAARFNITVTPTLFLIRQGNDKYLTISVGVISLGEMERKLYRAIRYLDGDTDIDTFTTMDYEKGGSLDPRSILNKNRGDQGGGQ